MAASGPRTGRPFAAVSGVQTTAMEDDAMPAPDQITEGVAELERLAVELASLGLRAHVYAHGDRLHLDVENHRHASVLGERVYVQGGSFWWSWAEVIAGTDEVTKTAATLANVLRTVGGE